MRRADSSRVFARGTTRACALVVGVVASACGPERPAADAARRSPFAEADSLRDMRRFAAAHPRYRVLRDSFALAGDTANWWYAQLWWAQTLMRVGEAESSAVAIRDAMQLAGADRERQAWGLLMQCGLASRTGRGDDAVRDCGRARVLAEGVANGNLLARIHLQLGTVYSRRGLFPQAVAETERALALERRHGRVPQQLAGVLNSMGVEYAAVGRLTDADRAYEEGLQVARALADTSTAGVLRSNLAALRAYAGRTDDAIALMSESLDAAQVIGDTSGMVYAFNSLAAYYLDVGNRAAARAYLERSLAAGTAQSPAIYRVVALVNLARIELAEGRIRAADSVSSAAVALTEGGGFVFERVRAYQVRCAVALRRRDVPGARRALAAAHALADSLGSPQVEVDLLTLEGRVRELERRSDAAQAFLQAIDLLESWRGRLALGDLRLGLAEPRWQVYEGAIRTLLAAGDTAGAFVVGERARARTLLEILAERDPGPGADARPALRQRLRQRFEQRRGTTDPGDQRTLDAEIRALTASLGRMEGALPRAELLAPRPASVELVRTRLLASGDAALLAVFWGDSAVYGWWVERDAVTARRLGSADSLSAVVEFLRRRIERTADDTLWKRAAEHAYTRLLAPFGRRVPATLLVIPDGPLAHVPLEVLVPSRGALPLAADHALVYGPSASVLAALAAETRPARWSRSMLAVGNPQGSSWGAGSDMVRRRTPEPPPLRLPNAEREARALAALYAGRGADLLLGRRVTQARWMALSPARYRYLHFATHARVSDREPERSALLLADGPLDVPAIRRLSINAELVTLSACETALGREVRGEGTIGLAHAFLSAGARGVVVSLWPVADRSTDRFMRDFYGALHAGAPAADALVTARRQWIVTPSGVRHPASWAPFILVGAVGPRPPADVPSN